MKHFILFSISIVGFQHAAFCVRTELVAMVINDGGGGGGCLVGTSLIQGGKVIAMRRWSGCEGAD